MKKVTTDIAELEPRHKIPYVAKRLGLSPQTVRRIVEDHPDVKTYGERITTKAKRRYRTLLIPEHVIIEIERSMA